MEIRQERQRIGNPGPGLLCGIANRVQLRFQHMHAANLRHRHPGQDDYHAHLEDELKQISDQHSPKPADGGVDSGERNEDKNADQQGSLVWSA